MATVSNYGELKTYVSTTGHRGDLASEIPGFIESAESMIAAKVRAIELVTTIALTESDRDSGAVYDWPSNCLGIRAVIGTKGSQEYALKHVSLSELYRYGTSGDPVVFATYAKKIEFRASPATNSTFTLIYYAKPAAFSDDADTNALLTNHPDLYQHAAMHWFHIHTQDVELAVAHENAFNTVADNLNALAEEVRGAASVANQYNYSSGSTM